MSGFFLAGMLENLNVSIVRYYARRLIRLVPPAIAAVVILTIYTRLALKSPLAATDAASDALQFYSDNHVFAIRSFLLNLLLIHHTINPPLWTIRIEIATSILFPLLVIIKNLHGGAWYRLVILIGLILMTGIIGDHQKYGLDIFQYLYLFYAGILIRDFGVAAARIPIFIQYLLVASSILGIALIGVLIPTNGLHPIQFDLPVTICGGLLITLLAHGRASATRTFMQSRPIQFLGRISYSFYLISWLTIDATGTFALEHDWPQLYGFAASIIIMTLVSTTIGLLAAYGLHLAVEKPSVAVSRSLGHKPAYNAS